MPRYLLSFLFLFLVFILFYVMFCFVLTSPPLMLCVYLQSFEAALFWKKKKLYVNNLPWWCVGLRYGFVIRNELFGEIALKNQRFFNTICVIVLRTCNYYYVYHLSFL